ncbi:hypothetical protein HY086_03980 [Candidatus Gottesmanbacteria bacterium]|nr:hypothetical protein [Candidatus Gottesmanbacteria bacterium]
MKNHFKHIATVVFFGVIVFYLIAVASSRKGPTGAEVFMTASGFSPRKIEIAVGSQVTFTNNDTIPHWPASNFHPDHAIYPEFDPRKAVKPGFSWSFIPHKNGVFQYHDHLVPTSKGTIVLGSESQKQNNRLTSFFSSITMLIDNLNNRWETTVSADRFRKLPYKGKYKAIKAMIKEQGAVSAWQFIASAYDPAFRSTLDTHNLAHFIGGKIFEEKGVEGITICTPLFVYGCYHGVAERALGDSLDTLSDLEKACRRLGHIHTYLYQTCLHGIGHGLGTFSDSPNLESALVLCDRLGPDQSSCYSGVFMEFDFGSRNEDSRGLISLCDRFDKKFKLACAGRMVNLMEKTYGIHLTEITHICVAQKDLQTRDACLEIIGMTAGTRSNGKPEIVLEKCSVIGEDRAFAACITAALVKIVEQQFPGWDKAVATCDKIHTPERLTCRQLVEAEMAWFR